MRPESPVGEVAAATPTPPLVLEGRPRGQGPNGEVRFLDPQERVRIGGALESMSLLRVEIAALGVGDRGRLAEVIDDALERVLLAHGASSPGIGASCDADSTLADQLYRARHLGRFGLVVALPSLSALVDARGVLDADDGATLRFLARCTLDRPVVLLLDASNRAVMVHGSPKPMGEVLQPQPEESRAVRPTIRVGMTPTPARVVETPKNVAPIAMRTTPSPSAPVAVVGSTREPPPDAALTPMQLSEAMKLLESVSRSTPLATFERAFVDAYAPLRRALLAGDRVGSAGLGRGEVSAQCDAFSSTFSRAYSEAMPTFGATGKHPRMLFELFALTQKCARVHGARSSQVVLVDALRWDVARRLRARLTAGLDNRAVCVEEQILWSVLPTTTAIQLDAIVRGEDALRAPIHPERETEIVRDRSLDVLRRMRLGHREVMKLDLLEGRLRESGIAEGARIDAMAAELTPVLGNHLVRAPLRTLVVIVGDHGFALPQGDSKETTAPATQGGASPEEVFVPLQAWLVGGVH